MMAKRKQETAAPVPVAVPPSRKKPDMTGVPGEVVSLEGLELSFGFKKASPYDALLLGLVDSPDRAKQALKFNNPRCRPSVYSRARKLGIRVTFAERDGVLYVRVDGRLDEDIRAKRRSAIVAALRAKGCTLTHIKLTNILRDAGDESLDAASVDAILHQMLRTGQIVRGEGATWAVNPAYKGA